MGQYAVKLLDPTDGQSYYIHWSEVVDAPVFVAKTLAEYREYFQWKFGDNGVQHWNREGCWERLEMVGTSTNRYGSADDAIACNRAGPREKQLDREGILDRYCRGRPSGAR